jgi:hypothetical protein
MVELVVFAPVWLIHAKQEENDGFSPLIVVGSGCIPAIPSCCQGTPKKKKSILCIHN